MYARRMRSFSERECDLVTVTVLVCINLTLPVRKSRSVQMTVYKKKNIKHENINSTTGKMSKCSITVSKSGYCGVVTCNYYCTIIEL